MVALNVHVETAQLTLLVRRGLTDRLELQLALPALADTGGFLDRPIEVVEGLFHALNAQRALVPRGVAFYQLLLRNGAGIVVARPDAGLGDVWSGLKLAVTAQHGVLPALSLRGMVKAPTAREPFGSRTLDVGGSLLLGWRGGRLAGALAVDVEAPTGDLRTPRVSTRPYGALQGGLAWRVAEHVTLDLQASAHTSPLRGTGLTQIDSPTFYVLGGVQIALRRGLVLRAGVAENVFSPFRGADITFVVGLGG